RAQTLTDLAVHKANFDYDHAAVQQLANITNEIGTLAALHNQHVASQTPPPPPPEPSAEEKAAKPWERMTWADSFEIANTSKHVCDPEAFKRRMAEVMARRQRGE